MGDEHIIDDFIRQATQEHHIAASGGIVDKRRGAGLDELDLTVGQRRRGRHCAAHVNQPRVEVVFVEDALVFGDPKRRVGGSNAGVSGGDTIGRGRRRNQ